MSSEKKPQSEWMKHLLKVKKEKNLTLVEAMKIAKETYKKK
jgi:hypothetical protein